MALDVVQTVEVTNVTYGPLPVNDEKPVETGYLQPMDRNPLFPKPAMVVSQNTRRMASMITTGRGNSRFDTNRKTFAPT